MQTVIENTKRPVYSLSEDETPFYNIERKAPVAPVAQDQEMMVEEIPETEDALPAILSDSTALGVISRRFNPLGSMVLGSRGFLQLPKGQTIEKGQKFKAEIKGVSYEVLISEITEKGYTLKLGTATLERSFNVQ